MVGLAAVFLPLKLYHPVLSLSMENLAVQSAVSGPLA